MPVLLAHGALGVLDEVLFLGIGVVFVAMMALSWLKSRYSAPKNEEVPPVDKPAETAPDRFPLE